MIRYALFHVRMCRDHVTSQEPTSVWKTLELLHILQQKNQMFAGKLYNMASKQAYVLL